MAINRNQIILKKYVNNQWQTIGYIRSQEPTSHDDMMEILNYESAADEYIGRNRNLMTRTISGSPSNTEGSVTKGYDINVYATHRLRYNSYVVIGTAVADIVSGRPNYPYLLTAQDRLQIDMKMTYQTPLTLYLNRFTLWGSNNNWRTIARAFRPCDDVHRFTFHHSTIFDY